MATVNTQTTKNNNYRIIGLKNLEKKHSDMFSLTLSSPRGCIPSHQNRFIERLSQAQVEAQSTSPKEVLGKGLSLN